MIPFGAAAVLSATLSDAGTGTLTPIANRTVTLTLGSGAGAQSCTAVTESNGSASCTIGAVNQSLGGGNVSARFDGDVSYLASSTNASIWIFAGEACFVVDFREITYFRNTHVLTSSDADIRTRNGIAGGFDPSRWPYAPQGGSNKTKSRGTLLRIYGFSADQLGMAIPNADNPNLTYAVKLDTEISEAYYIDLGGPARVVICPSQLQTHLIGDGEQAKAWSLPGTTPLTVAQKNVPGIMLNHNVAQISIPERVRDELRALGTPLLNAQGHETQSGLVDYIGFQLWGHGNADYREFVDVNIQFIFDDANDRLKHYQFGFHTAKNGDFESFVGCGYLDYAPGDDAVRFNDVWAGRNQNNPQWGPARGSSGLALKQKVRDVCARPSGGLHRRRPTPNTRTDPLRFGFGRAPQQRSGGKPAVADFLSSASLGQPRAPCGRHKRRLLRASPGRGDHRCHAQALQWTLAFCSRGCLLAARALPSGRILGFLAPGISCLWAAWILDGHRPHHRPRRPPAQPQKYQCRDSPRQIDGHNRPFRLRQIVAGL